MFRDMQNNNHDLPGFLTGIIVGGLLGVLYAPSRGEQTREKLRHFAQNKAEEFQGTLEEKRDSLAENLRKIEEEIKGRADKMRDDMQENMDTDDDQPNKRM